MIKSNEIRSGRHCVFNLHVHLVFVTKYRKGNLTKDVLGEMRVIFKKVCDDFEVNLVEFKGKDDHVHLLILYPPKVQLSKLVNSLKGVSSRRLRKKYPDYWEKVLWSPSYFAGSCGGAPIKIIQKYIEKQSV